MNNSTILCLSAFLVLASGCAYKEFTPREAQE